MGTSALMRRSSVRITLLEAPLPAAGLHHEEAPLKIVQDSEETLAVLTERRLLGRVSMGIPPVGLGHHPP